jgi:C4-dicarboxylate-specific signal transduction histidine kinase
MVAVPRQATLGSGDEALLADALAMLAIFYQRAQLSERKREHERGALQAHHLARIGELATGVAHGVNNPLSAITHLAEVLLEEEELSEEARRTATAILD